MVIQGELSIEGGFKPSAYYGLLDFEQVFVQWERSDRNPGQSQEKDAPILFLK